MNPYDYENRTGVHSISWGKFHRLCKGLAQAAAGFDPEIILPILRGGIFPGTQIAFLLQADVYPIRLSRRENDRPVFDSPRWILEPPEHILRRRVLIVDEIASTGETLALARARASSSGAAEVMCAVLYAHSRGTDEPDLIGMISDELIVNPWDREIYRDRAFLPHPEYTDALSHQNKEAVSTLLSCPPSIIPAKS